MMQGGKRREEGASGWWGGAGNVGVSGERGEERKRSWVEKKK